MTSSFFFFSFPTNFLSFSQNVHGQLDFVLHSHSKPMNRGLERTLIQFSFVSPLMHSFCDPCGSELCCSSLGSSEHFEEQWNLPSLCCSFSPASLQLFWKFSYSNLIAWWFSSRSFQHPKASFSPRARNNGLQDCSLVFYHSRLLSPKYLAEDCKRLQHLLPAVNAHFR